MKVEYDTPIEVSEYRYKILMTMFAGIIAGREHNGRFYIKVWAMKYSGHVEKCLTEKIYEQND